MASMFVATGSGDKDQQQHQPHPSPRHNNKVSPRSSFKKTWSSNPPPPPSPPSPCGHGDHHQAAGGALPKCVCAPTTHAGSFKCRLHRVNSNGHSAPPAPPASAPETSTWTVEAQ